MLTGVSPSYWLKHQRVFEEDLGRTVQVHIGELQVAAMVQATRYLRHTINTGIAQCDAKMRFPILDSCAPRRLIPECLQLIIIIIIYFLQESALSIENKKLLISNTSYLMEVVVLHNSYVGLQCSERIRSNLRARTGDGS